MASVPDEVDRNAGDSNQHWKKHRQKIQDLYVIQRLPLKEVRRLLHEQFSFSASESQYKRKFREWGVAKNLKASICQAIGISLEIQGVDQKNATAIVRGIPLTSKRLNRALRRHQLTTLERKKLLSGKDRHIPADIQIHTSGDTANPSSASFTDVLDGEWPTPCNTAELQSEVTRQEPLTHLVLSETLCISDPVIGVPPQQEIPSIPPFIPSWIAQYGQERPFKTILPFVIQAGATVHDVNWLIQNGANINTFDGKSWTGLHYAVDSQNLALVQLLLAQGASPEGLDHDAGEFALGYRPRSDRETPLSLALMLDNLVICEMLLQAGTDLKMTVGNRPICSLSGYIHQNSSGVRASNASDQMPRACCFPNALQFATMSNRIKLLEVLLKSTPSRCYSQLYTPLFLAVWRGHLEILTLLLNDGADVNETSSSHLGQLHSLQAASYYGNLKIVSTLVQAGANVNARPVDGKGKTALQYAVDMGHKPIVTYLLQQGADVNAPCAETQGLTALQSAVLRRNHELVELLLIHGADVNQRPAKVGGYTALSAAIVARSGGLFRRLIKAGANVHLVEWPRCDNCSIHLLLAARGGAIEFITGLFHYGLDADMLLTTGESLGELALLEACRQRFWQAVKLIIQHCSVVKPYVLYELCDKLDITADRQIIQLLMQKGADANALGKDGSLFEKAFRSGNLGIIRCLLLNGAQPDLPSDQSGRAALQVACAAGNTGLVRLLIHHGADVNAVSGQSSGRTALDAACESGHTDLVELLLRKGALVNLPSPPDHPHIALQSLCRKGWLRITRRLASAWADFPAARTLVDTWISINAVAASDRIDMIRILLDAWHFNLEALFNICVKAAAAVEDQCHREIEEFLETYQRALTLSEGGDTQQPSEGDPT